MPNPPGRREVGFMRCRRLEAVSERESLSLLLLRAANLAEWRPHGCRLCKAVRSLRPCEDIANLICIVSLSGCVVDIRLVI